MLGSKGEPLEQPTSLVGHRTAIVAIVYLTPRKMRSQLMFVAVMLFVSIAYYIMAYGQPTNGSLHAAVPGFAIAAGNAAGDSDASAMVGADSGGSVSGAVVAALNGSGDAESWPPPPSSANDFYLMNQPDLCNQSGPIQLMIMVVTAPTNFDARLAIRRTWGSVAHKSDIKLVFALGLPSDQQIQGKLVEERDSYHDLVQGRFMDAYYNLTQKSIMLLKWTDAYCQKARYLLKIDDDCFLHPSNLLKFLQARKEAAEGTATIYGRLWKKVKPIRDKSHKWAVMVDVWPDKEFPDYTGGPSYVVSRKAIPALLEATSQVKTLNLEDIYLTGICAEKAKVPRVNDNRFNVDGAPTACASQDVISYHHVTPDLMYMLWWIVNDRKFDTCSSKEKGCPKNMNKLLADLTNVVLSNLHV